MKKIFELLKSGLGRGRKMGAPHSYEDTTEGFDIGDEKVFSDGSTRVLGYAPASGQRRWLSTKEAEEKGVKGYGGGGSSSSLDTPPMLEEIPEEIIIDEWKEYNKFLNEENPFMQCITYGQMESVWFARAYELNSRLTGTDEETRARIPKKRKQLDDEFLAIQMYKVSCLIFQIQQWEEGFDYKAFIKEHSWQELVDYLEGLKQPQEVDYMPLYETQNQEENV